MIKKKAILLCGPSGSGKSTLVKRLFAEFPALFGFSVSHTTRQARIGELDGREYHFVNKCTFEEMVKANAFIEHAVFSGNCYGTSTDAVLAVLDSGKNVMLDIERQGILQIKHLKSPVFNNALFPPSIDALRQRLTGRGSETPESLQARLDAAADEMTWGHTPGAVDHIIVNDNVDEAYVEVKQVLGLQ